MEHHYSPDPTEAKQHSNAAADPLAGGFLSFGAAVVFVATRQRWCVQKFLDEESDHSVYGVWFHLQPPEVFCGSVKNSEQAILKRGAAGKVKLFGRRGVVLDGGVLGSGAREEIPAIYLADATLLNEEQPWGVYFEQRYAGRIAAVSGEPRFFDIFVEVSGLLAEFTEHAAGQDAVAAEVVDVAVEPVRDAGAMPVDDPVEIAVSKKAADQPDAHREDEESSSPIEIGAGITPEDWLHEKKPIWGDRPPSKRKVYKEYRSDPRSAYCKREEHFYPSFEKIIGKRDRGQKSIKS